MKRKSDGIVKHEIEKAINKIEYCLDGKMIPEGTDSEELVKMKRVLGQMLSSLQNKTGYIDYPGMGRVITDSWPHNSELGGLILRAEIDYEIVIRQLGN